MAQTEHRSPLAWQSIPSDVKLAALYFALMVGFIYQPGARIFGLFESAWGIPSRPFTLLLAVVMGLCGAVAVVYRPSAKWFPLLTFPATLWGVVTAVTILDNPASSSAPTAILVLACMVFLVSNVEQLRLHEANQLALQKLVAENNDLRLKLAAYQTGEHKAVEVKTATVQETRTVEATNA